MFVLTSRDHGGQLGQGDPWLHCRPRASCGLPRLARTHDTSRDGDTTASDKSTLQYTVPNLDELFLERKASLPSRAVAMLNKHVMARA